MMIVKDQPTGEISCLLGSLSTTRFWIFYGHNELAQRFVPLWRWYLHSEAPQWEQFCWCSWCETFSTKNCTVISTTRTSDHLDLPDCLSSYPHSVDRCLCYQPPVVWCGRVCRCDVNYKSLTAMTCIACRHIHVIIKYTMMLFCVPNKVQPFIWFVHSIQYIVGASWWSWWV